MIHVDLLLRRELRRLAPAGVLAVASGLAALAVDGGKLKDGASIAATFACLLLGLCLAVPDTQAGGAAFLARLPVSAPRLTATRLRALLLWSSPLLLAALLHVARSALAAWDHHEPPEESPAGLWVLCLGAGALSSSVARTAVNALGLAIVGAFAVGTVVSLSAPLTLLTGWNVLATCAGGTCLVLAARTLVLGELHRASWRPAGVAGAGLGAACAFVVILNLAGDAALLEPWRALEESEAGIRRLKQAR